MTQEEINKRVAINKAKKQERITGETHYVVKTVEGWEVTNRMPFMGEWYSTDGVRHG